MIELEIEDGRIDPQLIALRQQGSLTRTLVRSTMANTCSVGSRSSSSWPRSWAGAS
jgi:hypothetical protein